MPKLEGASIARKISLADIIDTGNIREDYQGIEELAESIKVNGLLQPIIVKNADPAQDGSPRFELIAGFRRRKAFQLLCDRGDNFSIIDAIVVAGDKLTLQLIENIQRSDLSARERERGIYLMAQNGLSQKEVAAKLSKSEAYISRHITAYRVRSIAEKSGIDTSPLETSTISEVQTIAENDVPMVISYIIRDGGTKAAAREIMKSYRPKKTEAEPVPWDVPETPAEAPAGIAIDGTVDFEEPGESPAKDDPPPATAPAAENPVKAENPPGGTAETKKPAPAAAIRPPIEHKKIDVNEIFDEIYLYLSALEKRIKELGTEAEQAKIDTVKREAALDIIALIHKRIGTGQE
jgi:ParB family chromosome partitioning protein